MEPIMAGLVEITTVQKKGGWHAVLANGIQHGPSVREKQLAAAVNAATRHFATENLPQAETRVSGTLGKLIAIAVKHHMSQRIGNEPLPVGAAQEHIAAILPHVRYGALSAALMLAQSKDRSPEFWTSVEARLKSERPTRWVPPSLNGWGRLLVAINAYASTTAKNFVVEGGVNRNWQS